jgi:hypothetical protein
MEVKLHFKESVKAEPHRRNKCSEMAKVVFPQIELGFKTSNETHKYTQCI